MSKLKAKAKAQSKAAKKIKAEEQRKIRVQVEKNKIAEKTAHQIDRNKDERITSNAKSVRSVSITKADFPNPQSFAAFNAVCASIKDDHILAKDFILEELEAASMGNDKSKIFALNSGIPKKEYSDSLDRSIESVETGPQAILIEKSMPHIAAGDIDGAVKMRLSVVNAVMKKYLLGKYSPQGIESERKDGIEFMFDEYLDYVNNSKLYTSNVLCQSVINIAKLIKSPSNNLLHHLVVAEIAARVGNKAKTVRIPAHVLGSIQTDLLCACLVKEAHFVKAIKGLVSSGFGQSEIIGGIDLCREVGEVGNRVINLAPAIHNLMSVMYAELPDSDSKLKYSELMTDASPVSGAINGSITDVYVYQDWCFEAIGD